jgi:putative transposase
MRKSHRVTVLLYHLVFPAKCRRAVFEDDFDEVPKEMCLNLKIGQRYEIRFLEMGTDKDHVHFFAQLAPRYSVTKMVKMLERITPKEAFRCCPQVKKRLWADEF